MRRDKKKRTILPISLSQRSRLKHTASQDIRHDVPALTISQKHNTARRPAGRNISLDLADGVDDALVHRGGVHAIVVDGSRVIDSHAGRTRDQSLDLVRHLLQLSLAGGLHRSSGHEHVYARHARDPLGHGGDVDVVYGEGGELGF